MEKIQGGKSEIGFPPSISAPQKASEYQVGTREGNPRIIPPPRNRPEPSSTVDQRVCTLGAITREGSGCLSG